MAATYAELAGQLPEHERAHVAELAKNALFMRNKLKETRKELEGQPVTIPYDNGGGQTGIRANPAFGEYEKLFRSYQSALTQLREFFPALKSTAEDDVVKPSALKSMRGKFRAYDGGREATG